MIAAGQPSVLYVAVEPATVPEPNFRHTYIVSCAGSRRWPDRWSRLSFCISAASTSRYLKMRVGIHKKENWGEKRKKKKKKKGQLGKMLVIAAANPRASNSAVAGAVQLLHSRLGSCTEQSVLRMVSRLAGGGVGRSSGERRTASEPLMRHDEMTR